MKKELAACEEQMTAEIEEARTEMEELKKEVEALRKQERINGQKVTRLQRANNGLIDRNKELEAEVDRIRDPPSDEGDKSDYSRENAESESDRMSE